MTKANALIGQSGGPTSVINASLCGAIEASKEAKCIRKILGMNFGIEGLMEEKLIDLVDRLGGLEQGDIYAMVMQRVEKPLITLVLRKTEGNQVRAAGLLGINRNTLRKKIKELGIKGPFGAGDEGKDEEEL